MNLRPKFYNGWLMLFLMIFVVSCFSQELPLTANALPTPTGVVIGLEQPLPPASAPIMQLAQLPPSPPGAVPTRSPKYLSESNLRMTTAVAVPGMTNGTFRIEVQSLPPLNQIVSFYVATNCPPRWRLERSSDAINWTVLEMWESQSNYPRHIVPRLRDDANLVTWVIEKPAKARFFRLKVLP